jgi:hypothetical protein
MRDIDQLVETYLIAERDLVIAVDAAGGSVQLQDGRTVTAGRAEFDAMLGRQRRRRGRSFGKMRRCRRGGDYSFNWACSSMTRIT